MATIQLEVPREKARAEISKYYVSNIPCEYFPTRSRSNVDAAAHFAAIDDLPECVREEREKIPPVTRESKKLAIDDCRQRFRTLECPMTFDARCINVLRTLVRFWREFMASVEIVRARSLACE